MKPIRLGLLGASGRMGRAVIQVAPSLQATIAAAPPRGGDFSPLFEVDAIIDFALPEAVVELMAFAGGHSKALPPLVIASTGWKPADLAAARDLGKSVPILMSSNFSVGALALREILYRSAPFLARLGYQPVIVESHHRHKRDAPSGTAKMLRAGLSDVPEGYRQDDIAVHSIRAGGVVGDHEVHLVGEADRLLLGHYAQDRAIFARGAIEAARWLLSKQPGFYSLEDYFNEAVLFLQSPQKTS